jgi:NAD(P)-dependent dehydrogenase (short-subunit alcohol dehydrogenase family)
MLEEPQPIKRIAKPEEIAYAVTFLFSDESSFMTGALVAADEGYTCR